MLFLPLGSPVFCQVHQTDSLEKLLDQSTGQEKIEIYIELSRIHLQTSLAAALNFAEEALLLSEEIGDVKGKADALNRKGNVYYYFADYERSLGFYLESLALREMLEDQEGIAASQSNIALIYSDFGDHEKAIEYTLKSYETFLEIEDKSSTGVCLNNLTYYHLLLKRYPEALDYGMKTLTLYEELNESSGISNALNNLGDIYKETKRYDQALSHHLRSLKLNYDLGNLYGIANSKYNIAQLYFEISDYDAGIIYLSEGLPVAIELQSNDLIKNMYALLAYYYEIQGDYMKALENHDLYRQATDSIFNQETNNRIAAMQVKFEAERKNNEIQLLKQDQNIRNLARKKQKDLINYLIIFAIMVLVLGFFGLNSYRSRKTANVLLQKQNIQYYYANRDLSHSEKSLREQNATKDKFFSIIGHDLINPFQALLGLAELLHDHNEEISDEEIKKYSHLINLSAKNLFNLLQNLLQWASAQTGKLKYQPEEVLLSKQVEGVISLMEASAEKKNIFLVNDVDKETTVYTDRNILETVLRNLVNNAIKYTYPDGLVRIRSAINEEKVKIEVIDNGTGISEENLNKLFKLEQTFTTKGTSEEEGSGLGLILCKEFIEINGGEIWVESVPEQGSKFTFTIPRKRTNEVH